MRDSASSRTLVLFIDQMEELFTAQDPKQATIFLSALYQATQEQALWVIGTIRSDHLHYCHRHSDMVKVLRGRGHYPLGRVESYMMQDMILKPAQCAGLKITEALAKRLIHDTGAESANLPLLGFVLDKLFDQRTDHELSETAYNNLGGVTGAIGSHVKTVEEEIQRTLGVQPQKVLSRIFKNLAKVHKEEGIPTRNRPLKIDLQKDGEKVVDLLVTEGLLRTEGEGESATVSISHEKLFEAWPALKEYVDTNKKTLVDRTLLESRAQKWANMGRPWRTGLASGREYKDFQLAGGTDSELIRSYLSASYRWQWIVGVGIVLPIVAMIALGTWVVKADLITKQDIIRFQSTFMSIYVEPEMQSIDGGPFNQGDIHNEGRTDEQPLRDVTMNTFLIGKTEVTFEEYERFVIATGEDFPSDEGWGRGLRPVINVSWKDATKYAEWLSQETGKPYRLPTESEWEYAARSRGQDDIWAGTSDEKEIEDFAVYSVDRTSPVASKHFNGLGLYDMSGNVWEWVEDCWHKNYTDAPKDGSAWGKENSGNCGLRVIRGGSWSYGPGNLRTSARDRDPAGYRFNFIGFRLAQDTP